MKKVDRWWPGMLPLLLASLGVTACASIQTPDVPTAPAVVETDPVPGRGDSGDDVAIWIHPSDPSQSLIIGTDSGNGVGVYDLSGAELAFHEDGATGMVDVRYEVPLGNERVSIVAAGNLASNQIVFYRIDPETRDLVNVSARAVHPELTIYGTCTYHSRRTGEHYVFVTSEEGEVEQWRLVDGGDGTVDAEGVRSFTLNPEGPDGDYTIEGCVADDQLERLYLAQENAGRLWRVGAAPEDLPVDPVLIDVPEAEAGHTVGDVEGLALYYADDGTGYLIASNQGNHTYTVYTREGDNDYLMTFAISGSDSVDAVQSDDSMEITNVALGSAFPDGLVVVEDGDNTTPGNEGHDNYKLVRWGGIAALHSPGLTVDISWNPRPGGGG